MTNKEIEEAYKELLKLAKKLIFEEKDLMKALAKS